MIRKLATAAAAGAVALGGLAVFGVGAASAAPVVITAGPGSHVNCHITAKVKLATALKNDWVKADHQGDPNASVRAIPDTTFAANGVEAITAKAKSVSCTGTVTGGGHTAAVSSAKITLTQSAGATPGELTCAGLAPAPGSPARYGATVAWKASGAKITPTTISNQQLAVAGIGFALSNGTVTGSFAGGTSSTQANIDSATFAAETGQPSTSTTPSTSVCEAQLKFKKGVASLKAPKGLKKVGIVEWSPLDPGHTGTPSNLDVTR